MFLKPLYVFIGSSDCDLLLYLYIRPILIRVMMMEVLLVMSVMNKIEHQERVIIKL